MQWSSLDTGAEACHARSPAKVYEACPHDSSSGPSSRRQAPVESESLSEMCAPVPGAKAGVLSEECGCVKEPRGADTQSCASTVASPPAQRRTAKPPTTACLYLWPKYARRVSAHRHHRLRVLVDHLMCRDERTVECEDTRSTMELSKGRPSNFVKGDEDVEIDGALVAYSKRLLCPGSLASPWLTPSCCRDRSLAVIQSLWVQKLVRFHQCLKEWRQLAHAWPVWEGIATQLILLNHPHMAAIIFILLVTDMRPSEITALRKKDLVPPLGLVSHVGRS